MLLRRRLIDNIVIQVKAGKGGNGGVGFERSAQNPKGRPSGGDGGNGGSIYIEVDARLNSLKHLRRKVSAEDGERGGNNHKNGFNGTDFTIKVPPGSELKLLDENKQNATESGNEIISFRKLLAKGGRGGRGNFHFGHNNHDREEGQLGQDLFYEIDLKIIAEVGLVGLPNAGKSSFLKAASNANPEIAAYAFTTLSPNLGVIPSTNFKDLPFTIADIPGLIKGAHANKGLGHGFLKHIEKARTLIAVHDISCENYSENLRILIEELELYQKGLSMKIKLILANKSDLLDLETLTNRVEYLKATNGGIMVIPISAINGAIGGALEEIRRVL